MVERGLGFDDGILIVIDGAKGMRKAIDDVCGDHAVIQRCQLHTMLAIDRLRLVQHFKRAISTTTIIASANSVIARRTRHITRWTTADQRLKWSALALLDFKGSCNSIHNFSRLPMVQNIIANEIQQRLHQHHHPSKAFRFSTRKRT
jgi:transposase-like protein